MKTLLQTLIIICLVISSISPACKFMSGKSIMEFCFSDGSVQEMPVPDELLAFMPGTQQDHDKKQQTMDDCAFCFITSHFDKITPTAFSTLEAKQEHEALTLYQETKLRKIFSAYLSRGPPALFS